MNKVVFFGNEKLATGIPDPKPLIKDAVVAAGFEIEQVVTGKLSDLRPHEAKLAVLAAYGRIIPQSVLDEFPLGVINIHPSLLPQYRGTSPIEQAILDGLTKTGVSIMRLTAGMDEGPVYKQKSLQLNGTETKASLTEELQSLGAEILGEALPSITGGDLKPRQQPHPDRATYTKKITKEDGVIDWNEPAEVIERQIRAYAGWPKSSAKLADIDVIITSATLMVTPEVPRPGEIKFDKKHLYIGTGKDWLEVLSLQIPGKKEMPVTAFLAGYSNKL